MTYDPWHMLQVLWTCTTWTGSGQHVLTDHMAKQRIRGRHSQNTQGQSSTALAGVPHFSSIQTWPPNSSADTQRAHWQGCRWLAVIYHCNASAEHGALAGIIIAIITSKVYNRVEASTGIFRYLSPSNQISGTRYRYCWRNTFLKCSWRWRVLKRSCNMLQVQITANHHCADAALWVMRCNAIKMDSLLPHSILS